MGDVQYSNVQVDQQYSASANTSFPNPFWGAYELNPIRSIRIEQHLRACDVPKYSICTPLVACLKRNW